MLRKFIWLMAGVALVLPFAVPSFAQERPADALVIASSSGLWLSNEQGHTTPPVDLPENANYTYYGALQVSPSGRYVAFQSVVQNFAGASGATPTNLYLLDLNANSVITVYEQPPASDSSFGNDVSDLVAWSADGTQLAYATLNASQPVGELHIFDVNTQTDTVIKSDLPIAFGVPFAPDVVWTSLGVSILTTTVVDTTAAEVLHIYDPVSGAEVLTVDFIQAAISDVPVEYFVAQRGNDEVLVVPMLNSTVLFNLTTRQFETFEGVLQMVVRDTGTKLTYLPVGAQGGIWDAELPDGSRYNLPYRGLWRERGIAISATGQTVAFVDAGSVRLWSNGAELGSVNISAEPANFSPTDLSIVWGTARWQIIEGGYG